MTWHALRLLDCSSFPSNWSLRAIGRRIELLAHRAALPKPVGLRIGNGDRQATVTRTPIAPSKTSGLWLAVTRMTQEKDIRRKAWSLLGSMALFLAIYGAIIGSPHGLTQSVVSAAISTRTSAGPSPRSRASVESSRVFSVVVAF